MKNVSVLIGAGSIGEAIIRRIATGHTVIVADLNRDNAQRVVETLLNAGFDAQATTVDLAVHPFKNSLTSPAHSEPSQTSFRQRESPLLRRRLTPSCVLISTAPLSS